MKKKKSVDLEQVSTTIFRKRLRKFKTLKRGYYSFIFLLTMYIISFFCPFLLNNKALIVRYEGKTYFPVFKYYAGKTFGQEVYGEANYRELREAYKAEGGDNWVLMPPYPYSPLSTASNNSYPGDNTTAPTFNLTSSSF